MTQNSPYEYFAASAVVLSAFFLFLQVAIYGDAGKGWIDRPWYIRAPMSLVAASLCYKFYSWAWCGEHFTHGGAIASFCIALWQFTSMFYAVTQSYRQRAEKVTKALMDDHPAWGHMDSDPKAVLYIPKAKSQ